jgi:hypothetical protein
MKKKYILVVLLLSSIACFSQFSENFESGVPGSFIETQDAEAISWGACGGSLRYSNMPYISGNLCIFLQSFLYGIFNIYRNVCNGFVSR